MLVKHRANDVEVTEYFRGIQFTQAAPEIPKALVGISNQIALKFQNGSKLAQEFLRSNAAHFTNC